MQQNSVQQIIATVNYAKYAYPTQKVLNAIKNCRTSKLGYHVYQCSETACGNYKYVYHSCRNRHCPQCGSMQQAQWIDDRRAELLPINYYHVVFTLPHELNSIIMGNQKKMYQLLFASSAQTLLQFAKDKKHLGATPGIISVLHTWGQNMSFHPHIHCIVSGGGIVKAHKKTIWQNAKRNKDNFLFPVLAMAQVFKAIYIKGVRALLHSGEIKVQDEKKCLAMLQNIYDKKWVVYAKQPFGGPAQVIEYLARYTHKVAITNKRIAQCTATHTTFRYRDYADNNTQKKMTITNEEFVRRLAQHFLPKGFCKIRSYGYLANNGRSSRIKDICSSMNIPPNAEKIKIPWHVRLLEKYQVQINQCPHCKCNSLVLSAIIFAPKICNDS